MKNRLTPFLVLCILATNGLNAQVINTVAGNGTTGYTFDNIAATASGLNRPWSVAVDGAGNIYIADENDQRIRKVSTSGIITTVAGVGTVGYSGDGGPATLAQLSDPGGIAVDGSGNLYIADFSNNVIRRVNTLGIISTFAGNGTGGYTFDGIAATASELNNPKGVAVDVAGNVFIADYRNSRIRRVGASGIIRTVAGDGSFGYGGDTGPATAAQLFFPAAVAVDGGGNLYIADENNNAIRKVSSGIINTIAGDGFFGYTGDGIAATIAELNTPEGVAVDGSGNVYIADYTNQRIRKINTSGIISTIAGTGAAGFSGENSLAITAVLNQPSGVTVGAGGVYLADQFNDRVRKISVGAVPPIAGNTSICIGGISTLSDASTGGTWTSSNTGVAIIGLGSGTFFGLSAGTSIITYKVTGISVFTTVTVNAFPVAGTISGSGTVCTGSTITLTDAATGGAWSSSNANATVTGGVVAGILAGTATISYTVTNSCGTAVATKVITVNSLSAGTITGLPDVCAGFSILLSDGVIGGVWSASNSDALVAGGIVFGLSAGVDTIYYTVTGSCGTVAATHVVTVGSVPIAGPIAGPFAVCVGSGITLSDSSPGGVWSSSNGNATVTSGGLVTGMAAGTDTISYTITDPCGSSTATAIITISFLSAGSITGPGSVCAGSSITLSDAVTGGVWSSSNANATVSGGVVTGITAGPDTIIYTVSTSCGFVATFATVAINPFPVVGSISGPSAVCVGSSIALSDLTAGGMWSRSNVKATVSVSGIVTGFAVGVDTIMYSVTNSCGTGIVSKVITINPAAIAGTITGPSAVCVGAAISLADGVSGGIWLCSNTHTSITTGGILTGFTPGLDTVSYIVTGACGTAITTAIIMVNTSPVVSPVTGATVILCAGSTIHLADGTPGGVWSSSDTFIAKVNSAGIVTGVVIGTANIIYRVTIGGCSGSAGATVNVGAAIPGGIVLPSGAIAICNDSSVLLYVVGSGPVTYQWMVNGTTIPGATTLSYTAHTAGNYAVYISSGGCSEMLTGTTVLTRIIPIVTFTPPNTLSTGSFITYEWYLDGKFIPAATNNSIHATANGKYTVAVLDDNLCHDTSAVYTIGSVGVNTVANDNDIRIYPNPATSMLNIDAPLKVNVSLLSMDGKLLLHEKDVTGIDISNLANGLYLVMIYDENNLLVKAAKFVKAE